ncbi:DUF4396 domain-containing protein [Falsibacillus pallidus]|uniref:Uncharacterized protein DUF4396 n=1 Tax=Falsibacillus pallidus TaxID=493781 RepID=A0A370GP76_9BACI|nr:DUF4396 domain-containing protein [Falsibacillus pallidus]RDI45545.1 uncharacterized protein DUF4396 [Falsibacillus pallidus]
MTLLTTISYIALALGIISALIILIDIIKNPQPMGIMNIVWPINGLYLGPFGIWAYWVMGRSKKEHNHHEENHDHDHNDQHDHENMHGDKPFWQSVFVSTSHCSSGCTFGDAAGVPIVFLTGLTIAGSTLFAHYLVEFIFAYIFGVFFQVFSIVPMSRKMGDDMSWGKGFWKAIKADTLSLVAFEIGMFGWMAIVHYLLFTKPPEPNTAVYWFMMQIAMILGALTSYPANWLLVKKGVKHGM